MAVNLETIDPEKYYLLHLNTRARLGKTVLSPKNRNVLLGSSLWAVDPLDAVDSVSEMKAPRA